MEIAEKQRHIHLLDKVRNNRALTKKELEELAKLEEKNKKKRPKKKNGKNARAAEIAAAELIDTQKDAANYAGVSTRTIRRWTNEGMLTVTAAGKKKFIKSQLDFFKRNSGKEATEEKKKKETAEAEYKDGKAKLIQMELKIKQQQQQLEEGKLITIDEVIGRIQAVKRVLLILPRKLPPQLAGQSTKRMQQIIRKEIIHAIEVFAGQRQEL